MSLRLMRTQPQNPVLVIYKNFEEGTQEYGKTRIQEDGNTGRQEYRKTGRQEYRKTGIREYRNRGIQEDGNTGIRDGSSAQTFYANKSIVSFSNSEKVRKERNSPKIFLDETKTRKTPADGISLSDFCRSSNSMSLVNEFPSP